MAVLCNRAGHYIFALWFVMVALCNGGGHIYFHAVLECRSEMICTWLAENTGRKNDAKNSHLGTIPQLCRAISSQLRHASTIGKKIAKQQYLLHMSPQYGELRPTGG